ncbi:AEC family transporter [Rummeliibacillus pycnus]|uniref:AEC family transporter n=1 Tax=Rummeliibacillus pycnus TaxID=101070 RepID=UPI000C9B5D5F|nr:AEC family transporter [Rummeliibacillus pycnus]
MIIIVNVILPIFAIIAVGYIAGSSGMVPKSGAKTLNNFVFYIALPALLFKATAAAPIEQLVNWQFIAINLGGILASFILAVLISKWVFKKDISSASLYGMNTSYGTTGYMGIPLVIAAFGSEAALPAALATLIHNIPVISIVLLVCESALVINNNKQEKKLNILWQIIKPVVTSPLTISVIAGIIVAIAKIPLPTAVWTFSDLLANASGSTALFAIGLGLVGQMTLIKESEFNKIEIGVIVSLKLIFQPFITFILFMYVFDIEPLWAVVSLIMSALPVGAGVFVFAQKYEKMMNQTLMAILVSIFISVISLSIILMYVDL